MNLLELEVSGDSWASDEVVQECVTRALAAAVTPQTKLLVSQRGLQFAEDYSKSIKRSGLNRAVILGKIPQITCSCNQEIHLVFCGV